MIYHQPFGIPVKYDAKSKRMADARGIWPFKRIVVGQAWHSLLPREGLAVLVHEAAHCLRFHLEKRILALPMLFIRPAFSMRLCAEQEMEADAFAVEQGYGEDLMKVLTRFGGEPGSFYPSNEERVTRLAELIRKRK